MPATTSNPQAGGRDGTVESTTVHIVALSRDPSGPGPRQHGQPARKGDAETVAESVAFLVLNHYGVDASGYAFAHVASWA